MRLQHPLVICGISLLVLWIATAHTNGFATQSRPSTVAISNRSLDWEVYDRLAIVISELPTWNCTDAPTDAEWRRLAEVATAFRSLSIDDLAKVLIVYMSKFASGMPAEISDPDPRTRPLLLLATMFDLSHPFNPDFDQLIKDRDATGVQICGGFHWNAGTHLSRVERFALPIAWTNDGPTVVAKRVVGVRGNLGGESHYPYQPHVELRHFQKYYPYRWNFTPFLIRSDITWRDLLVSRSGSTSSPDVKE